MRTSPRSLTMQAGLCTPLPSATSSASNMSSTPAKTQALVGSLDMLDVPGSGWCLMIPTSALQVARKMQAVLPYIFGGMHLQWNAEQENPAMGMYRLGCCGAHTRTHLG